MAILASQEADSGKKKNNGSRNIEAKSINQMKAVAEAECGSTKGADDTSIVRRDKLDAEVLDQLIALYWTIFL